MSVTSHNVAPTRFSNGSLWTADHLAAISARPLPSAPLIGADQAKPLLPDFDLWDIWPLQDPAGATAIVAGGALWMVLSAPRLDDPGRRHGIARIRLFHHVADEWNDCGHLFPDSLNPGSREWSGSACFDKATGTVTAYFTAAGRRGEMTESSEQRLFQTTGRLDLSGSQPSIVEWSTPEPLAINDGTLYADLTNERGIAGNIRGFRDPYRFADPLDGCVYILFTGSVPHSAHKACGVVGIARERAKHGVTEFELLPPIVSADGVANEMERPHMLMREGLYYVFWSTQRSVFKQNGPIGPTGLYGMVGASVTGPFEPLNGSGLVIANPPDEPNQAYCWQVLDDLRVVSFVDHWGLKGRDPFADRQVNRAQFGGTIAPFLRIAIDGNKTELLGLA